jgi:hypothetical protein
MQITEHLHRQESVLGRSEKLEKGEAEERVDSERCDSRAAS